MKKIMFFIPPSQHRGWPGTADVEAEVGELVITPCAASGSVNGSRPFVYNLQASEVQLLSLAFEMFCKRISIAAILFCYRVKGLLLRLTQKKKSGI